MLIGVRGSIIQKYGKIRHFCIFGLLQHFLIFYGIPKVREPSKNLRGTRGVVFPKSQPISSHGDPNHAQTSPFWKIISRANSPKSRSRSKRLAPNFPYSGDFTMCLKSKSTVAQF